MTPWLTQPEWTALLAAYGLLFFALSSPGPNVLAILGTSMERGRRAGIALALGVAFGTFLWSLIAVSGFAALMTTWAGAMEILRYVGAAYLLWLAWGAFKSAATPKELALSARGGTAKRLFLRGLSVQMSNPKAALFWVAIAAVGTGAGTSGAAIAALIIGCSLISLAVQLSYAVLFSTDIASAIYLRARRGIQSVLGAFFVFAAWRVATERG